MNAQLPLMLQQAIEAFQGGNFERASTILQRVIQVDAKNLPALHILGLIRASQANFKEAAHLLARAARIHPNDASIQYNLAKALADMGSDKESVPHHKKAVELAPQNPEAWLNYGKTESNLGRHENALIHYDKALNLNPHYAQAASNKSATLRELGRYEEALVCAEQALAMSTSLAEAWTNKGVVLKALKRYDEAITHYDQALTLKPDDYVAWANKGVALHELQHYVEAIACYDEALTLKHDYAEGWGNKGATLHKLKRYDDAIAHFDQALTLKPDYHEVWTNKGATLHDLKHYDQAIACYDKALSLNPRYCEAWINQGNSLKELTRVVDAKTAFEKAIELMPNSNIARWGKLFTFIPIIPSSSKSVQELRVAFTSELQELDKWFNQERLDGAHEAVGSSQPFYLAYQELNNKELLNQYGLICHRIMSHWQKTHLLQHSVKKENIKIRIGIISEQICNHSVWNAITKGLVLNLDVNKFEIHIFHLGTSVDDETSSARGKAKTFTDNQFSLLDLSKSIIEKSLDVLVYPEIGMHALTMQLACLRLAPIQIATWGHPETTGLPTIDYYLSSALFENESSQDAYTEALIKLPNLGCSYSRLPVIPAGFDVEQFGISLNEPILICPGAPFKYAPKNDWIFVEIARRLGKCKMVFFKDQNGWYEILNSRLVNAFKEASLALEDYVVFIPWLKSEQFYGLMKHADVFMDTIGFSGFNTAMQAVDCALPIVTREGSFMRGRFASGILKRMTILELIADSDETYIELVVRIAEDSLYRNQIINKMNETRHVLYDDPEPIRAFENFLLSITA